MKRSRFMLALLCCVGFLGTRTPVVGQADVPPNVASYDITARYDPATHTLAGQQTATYHNRTDAAIPTLVFHLYLNAFRSADTLWMRESGMGMRGYGYDPDAPGWIRIDHITLDDGTLLTVKALDADDTLVEATLPQPVAPGETVVVDIAFTAQLPRVFARTGWADGGNFVLGGQWFPKFGVWEEGAWNAYPFHANSEFYANFGRYDVALTLPQTWIVAATGAGNAAITLNADGTTTHAFVAEHVIDFVWAASSEFREMTRDVDGVAVRVFYYPQQRVVARRVFKAATSALSLYSNWYGTYGKGLYPQLSVVVVPPDAGGAGGMEYPTLFTVGTLSGTMPACVRFLEMETVHELAHQWFQSVIATDEAEEPWLDEGFTDYSTVRAMNALYDGALFDCGGWSFSYLAMSRMNYSFFSETPMAGTAWDFDGMEYAIAAYAKPLLALTTVERTVGEAAMLRLMRAYFDRYAFAHPRAEDVRAVMTETLGQEVADWFFDELVYGDGTLDAQIVALDTETTLERQGEACIPTTVKVTRGWRRTTESIPWACDQATLTLGDNPRTVEIDPDNAIVLDQNLINNGLHRSPDLATWLGLVVRWMQTLQDFFWGGAAW
jgi:hypothetical protein